MVEQTELYRLVGSAKDPHLPFSLVELRMLESVTINDRGTIDIVVNVPCHHCPGLQVLQDDIESRIRATGVDLPIAISFHGSQDWHTDGIASNAQDALRVMGVQFIDQSMKKKESA